MRVVATAGHVDHGKSTLVRALTGIEPDRWTEERRRGLTIDLGFAWMTLPDGERLAFVDVPGHERFVPNMLAGLGPVPAVMFVVAADGGWMPQSAEHLAAVDALRIRHGLLVVTRADLADPEPALRRARAKTAWTSLRDVDAVAVSAVTGAGLPELRAALVRLAAALPAPQRDAPVRLWVDRSFSIRGSGTVVTGTLPAGTVRTGDELMLAPSMRRVRVRRIETLGETAAEVTGVARVALNLRGVPRDVPARGMALVAADRWTLTRLVDVRLDVHAAEVAPNASQAHGPAPVPGAATSAPRRYADSEQTARTGQSARSAMPSLPREVIAHVGSARVAAKVRLLAEPEGGPVLLARLTLREPLPLHVGDRLLLRDPGHAQPVIVGATVLDVLPPLLRRRGAAAAAARELAGWPDMPTATQVLRRHGLLRVGTLTAAGVAVAPRPVVGDWVADDRHLATLRARLVEVVTRHTDRDPLAPGMPVEAACAALGLPDRRLAEVLARAAADPSVEGSGLDLHAGYLSPGRPGSGHPPDAGDRPVTASASDTADTAAATGSRDPAGGGDAGSAPAMARRTQGKPAPAGVGHGCAVGGGTGAAPDPLPAPVMAAVRAVLADLAAAPFQAPDADRLRELGLDTRSIAAAARVGLLLRVGDQVVLAPGADRAAAEVLTGLAQPFTTAEARKALHTSRRVAIPLLEYLDRAGITERLQDDRRRLRPR